MSPKNLTDAERVSVVCFLLARSNNGKIASVDITAAAEMMGRDRNIVSRIWQQHLRTGTPENRLGNVRSGLFGACGRRAALSHRMTVRGLAGAIQVSTMVVFRLLKEGAVRRHSNNVKPALTDANKLQRVRFALDNVKPKSDGTFVFDDMHDVVHIDEKWFNEDTDRKTYYLAEGEEEPARRRQSKRYIGKTMSIAAVARPRYFSVIFYDLSKLKLSHYIIFLLFGPVDILPPVFNYWCSWGFIGRVKLISFAKKPKNDLLDWSLFIHMEKCIETFIQVKLIMPASLSQFEAQ